MIFEEFNERNWIATNAERFAAGTVDEKEPLRSYAAEGPYIIILDASGISVRLYDEETDTYLVSHLSLPENKAACLTIGREMVTLMNRAASDKEVRAALPACGLPALKEL